MIKKTIERITIYQVIILITLFYFFYPTNNSSLDAFAYAGNIKYNDNLFLPHHLLYNYFIHTLITPIKFLFTNIDILLFSKYINTLFQVFNLIIFYKILNKLGLKKKEVLFFLIIVGFSFSLWRYGTENETYIIPITFSLLGSLFFLNYLKTKTILNLFYSGLFATVACLFHQIHFFWWFGLFISISISTKRIKPILIYSLTALLVPLSYILTLVYYNKQILSFNNLIHFIFSDFYTGSAKTEFGWNNLILTIISSIRTFFQVHPNIYFLIKENVLFIIPLLFLIYFLFKSLKLIFKKELFKKQKTEESIFINSHFFILLLQLIFAFYAVGNIEFMVMIPFLLFMSLFIKYKISQHILPVLAFTLFIWNFSYGIYPNYHYKYYSDTVLVDFIIEHPNDKFLIKNDGVLNQFYYKTGVDNYKNIILSSKFNSTFELNKIIEKNNFIYTDILDKPSIFDRAKIISANNTNINFQKFNKELVLSYYGFYGTSNIYKLRLNTK